MQLVRSRRLLVVIAIICQFKRRWIRRKLKRTLQDAYVSVAVQGKDVIIKVLPGNGPATSALIDQMDFDFVFGTIGDDKTVLAICTDDDGALQLQSVINELLE